LKKDYPNELEAFLQSEEGKTQYRDVLTEITREQDESMARKEARKQKKRKAGKENVSNQEMEENPSEKVEKKDKGQEIVKEKESEDLGVKKKKLKEKPESTPIRRSTRKRIRNTKLDSSN